MNIHLPDQIRTDRLLLRVPYVSDAEALFQSYTSDQEVTKYLTWKPHENVDETKTFLNICLDKWKKGTEYNYLIVKKENDSLIGMFKISSHDKSVNIGYVLAKSEWNNGYVTEAVKSVINYLFNTNDIDKVVSFCDVENAASAKVMEKSGLKFKEIIKRYVIHPNISSTPRDALIYELRRDEYQHTK